MELSLGVGGVGSGGGQTQMTAEAPSEVPSSTSSECLLVFVTSSVACAALARRHCTAHPCTLLLHVLLFSPSPPPCSFRESRRSLLPPSSPLSQRDATAYRSVCQNQRCLGNPSRIPAVDQETGKWAVWGSMDGYAETQLLFD